MAQEGCIKVGAVSFLNTKPLIQPILDNRISNIDLMLDVPSQIADELRVGTLDVGLIPIIEYFRFSDYRILPEISISSRGAVKSIRIFSRKPISECQTIALDTNSRTSRVLTQIILAEKYDIYPSFIDCPPTVNLESIETDAVLLIGDSALLNIGSIEFEVDLGTMWHDLFGLPFVYACWVTRYNIDLGDLPQLLKKAKHIGIDQIQYIASIESKKLGLSMSLCEDYLRNNIYYDLGSQEIEGMTLFYDLAIKHNHVPAGQQIRFPFMK